MTTHCSTCSCDAVYTRVETHDGPPCQDCGQNTVRETIATSYRHKKVQHAVRTRECPCGCKTLRFFADGKIP